MDFGHLLAKEILFRRLTEQGSLFLEIDNCKIFDEQKEFLIFLFLIPMIRMID